MIHFDWQRTKMYRFCMRIINIRFAVIAGLSLLCFAAFGQDLNPAPYDIGNPVLTEIWVDPVRGDDARDGLSAANAVRTINAAWRLIPASPATTGFRINILPGTLPFDDSCSNFYDLRRGSRTFPVIVSAFYGAGSVVIEGGLNIKDCQSLYLLNLTLAAGGSLPTFGNNVLHLESCTNVLLRGLTVTGPDPVQNPDNYDIQEVIKANQCGDLYLESSDVSGTYQTGVDFFSVQGGHVINSQVHGAGEWAMYLKGGSAYFLVHGNEFYDCGLGFRAGEGSNLEVMRAPWFHYECYDIKFVNNIVHDIRGVPLSVCGAYNFLAAYNTFVRVATNAEGEIDYPLLELVHGSRGCTDTSENGEGNAEEICRAFLDQGAWGTDVLNEGGEWIPNKNVFIYNNIFYNPAPYQTMRTQFWVQEAIAPPAITRNIPSPSRCDDNAVIRGNLIWNGPADHPFGIENSTELDEAALRSENSINMIEPELVDTARNNFRPLSGGSVFNNPVYAIPAFAGGDSPYPPAVPAGNLTNEVLFDFNGQLRAGPAFAGALSPASSATAVLAADIDGDALADLVNVTGSEWSVWFSSSGYLRRVGPCDLGISGTPAAGDIDGDGLADLVSVVGSNWYVWFSSSNYAVRSDPYDLGVAGLPVTGDIDGDGLADLIIVAGSNWYVWFSTMQYQARSGPYDLDVSGTPLTGDIDGDRLADLISVVGSNWYVRFSSSQYMARIGPYDLGISGMPAAGDIDGDRLADLMSVSSVGGWYVWFSTMQYLKRCGPYALNL